MATLSRKAVVLLAVASVFSLMIAYRQPAQAIQLEDVEALDGLSFSEENARALEENLEDDEADVDGFSAESDEEADAESFLEAEDAEDDDDEEVDFGSMTEEEKAEIMKMLSPEEREAFQQLLTEQNSHGSEL